MISFENPTDQLNSVEKKNALAIVSLSQHAVQANGKLHFKHQ